jgi:hypothetical protein
MFLQNVPTYKSGITTMKTNINIFTALRNQTSYNKAQSLWQLKRLAVSKRAAQKMDMERFNLNKLNAGKVKEKYQGNSGKLDDNLDIKKSWDTIRQNIKISAKNCLGYCESKYHKP